MLQHLLERVLPGFFAEIRQDGDVAADQGLQSRADGSEDRARTDDDPAHDAETFHNAITVQRRKRWWSWLSS